MKPIAPSLEVIEGHIFTVRGHRVMLDTHLAELYQVETKNLNKAVKRNPRRFPDDFMFQLTEKEAESLRFQIGTSNLRSQTVTSKEGRGGRRYLPFVFTEQGVAMLSSVLRSDRAADAKVARAIWEPRHGQPIQPVILSSLKLTEFCREIPMKKK